MRWRRTLTGRGGWRSWICRDHRLAAERHRLAEGGAIVTATVGPDREGMTTLMGLDRASYRVTSAGLRRRSRRSAAGCFRTSAKETKRPKGNVLAIISTDDFSSMAQTQEGRAFEGALTILRDEQLMEDLRRDLQQIIEHPFSVSLSLKERREFLSAESILRDGTVDVQQRLQRSTKSLREHIASVNPVRELELDAALRQLEREISVWMQTARARDYVPVAEMPAKLDVDYLTTSFYDPHRDKPAPPLEPVPDTAREPHLTLEDVRKQGGPLLADVRRMVVARAWRMGQQAGRSAERSTIFPRISDGRSRCSDCFTLPRKPRLTQRWASRSRRRFGRTAAPSIWRCQCSTPPPTT